MSGATRHTHDVASRSRPARSDARFSLSSAGSMSSRRSTRYTVVPLSRASRSNAVPSRTKLDTSAMCTPTSHPAPSGNAETDTASSTSTHPGGSMDIVRAPRMSRRRATSSAETVHPTPSGGRFANAAGVNGASGMSKRAKSAAVSASASPAGPKTRSTRASGCRLVARHPSTRTKRRWPTYSRARRVRSRSFGARRSEGIAKTLPNDALRVGLDESSVASASEMIAT